MSEIFKRIKEFPKLLVSNQGRVFVEGGTELKYYIHNGRQIVSIMINGRQLRRQVGILVLSAFKESRPSSRWLVEHIDGNEENNRVENLKWVRRTTVVGRQYRLTKGKETHVFRTVADAANFLQIHRNSTFTSAIVKCEARRQDYTYSIEPKEKKTRQKLDKMPLEHTQNDEKRTSSPKKKRFINRKIHEFVDYCDQHYSQKFEGSQKSFIGDIDESDPVVIEFRKFQKKYQL